MDEHQNPPRLRVAELVLVTGVAFAGPIFSAIHEVITHRPTGTAFLIFSLYYVRSRRIMPVILAHLYLDALALWYTVRQ